MGEGARRTEKARLLERGMTMANFAQIDGGLLVAEEFVAGVNASGIKPEGLDTMLLHSLQPASAAATITSNRFRAAPTYVTERHVADGSARTVIANSGNANAATGAQGMAAAERMAEIAAEGTGVQLEEALVCSTGRIGVQLPMDRVEPGVTACCEAVSRDAAHDAARAIMTTDTVPKECSVEFEVGGQPIVIIWQPGTASALDTGNIAEGRDVGTAGAFSRERNGEVLTFTSQDGQVIDSNGIAWDLLGQSPSGNQLTPVVGVNHFWFSWAAFKPETRVYHP